MSKEGKDNIELQVKQVLSEQLDIEIKRITDNASLTNDLGMDSFGSVEIAFELKERFGVEIPEEELANIKTVDDIIKYISSQLVGWKTKKND